MFKRSKAPTQWPPQKWRSRTPSENLFHGAGVDIKWNGPKMAGTELILSVFKTCQIPDILLVNSHDQDPITCHDFDHAAHNSPSVTGKRPSTWFLWLLKFHFKFQKSSLLSRGKEVGGGGGKPSGPLNSSEFLVFYLLRWGRKGSGAIFWAGIFNKYFTSVRCQETPRKARKRGKI